MIDSIGIAVDVAVSDQYAFIVDARDFLRVISINDSSEPVDVGYSETPEAPTAIEISNSFAYVTDDERGLTIFSIEDPENPEEIGFWATLGAAKDVSLWGDYAYVADGVAGLRIIDVVGDPTNPEEVGLLDTPGTASGVFVFEDTAYIADSQSGISIIDVSDPTNPNQIGFYDTPGRALRVGFSDGLIFVADQTNVGIYRFTTPNSIDDPVKTIPVKYRLYTAYPNPFNSSTTISYGLPIPSNISLQVYNLSGRVVRSLAKGSRPAGKHRATLNAADLPSGLYFVRMQASDHVFIQKVTLIR